MTAPCARGIGKKSHEGRKVLRVVTSRKCGVKISLNTRLKEKR